MSILSSRDDFVILDTETTGLTDEDVVIQIGVIDLRGTVLLDTLVYSERESDPVSLKIHSISAADVKKAPMFCDVYKKLCSVTDGKVVLMYNADFDSKLLMQTACVNGVDLKPMASICVMEIYTDYLGKRVRLPGGDHTSIGDCLAVLRLLEKIGR